MAMAVATSTASVAGARTVALVHDSIGTKLRTSFCSSSCRTAQLCSSFSGLSVQTWRKTRSSCKYGSDISGLSGDFSAPSPSSTRKLVFTVAKLKTHKASAKRFRVTGSGKIMRRQAFKQHLLRKKNSKRKRRLSKIVQVNRRDYDNVIGALPYLKVKGRLT